MWFRWKSGLDFEVWKGLSVLTTGQGGREGVPNNESHLKWTTEQTINRYLLLFWLFCRKDNAVNSYRKTDAWIHSIITAVPHGHRPATAALPNITLRPAAGFFLNFWLLIRCKKTKTLHFRIFFGFDKSFNTLSKLVLLIFPCFIVFYCRLRSYSVM